MRRHRPKNPALPSFHFFQPTLDYKARFSWLSRRIGADPILCSDFPIPRLPRSFPPIDPEGPRSRIIGFYNPRLRDGTKRWYGSVLGLVFLNLQSCPRIGYPFARLQEVRIFRTNDFCEFIARALWHLLL
jgi:hypothetical protein